MIIGGPYNLIAGQSITIPVPPAQQRGQYPYIAIFNSSPNVLIVTDDSGNQRYLQSLLADVWQMSTSGQGLTITPQGFFNQGAWIGTFTAIYYTPQDGAPTNYPTVLGQFPGGSSLAASLVRQLNAINQPIYVPAGTESIIIQNNGNGIISSLELQGEPSGTIYANNVTIQPGAYAQISITTDSESDSYYNLTYTFSSGQLWELSVYASSSGGNAQPSLLPIGDFATFTTGRIVLNASSAVSVLPAPSAGMAWYIKGVTYDLQGGSAASVWGIVGVTSGKAWYETTTCPSNGDTGGSITGLTMITEALNAGILAGSTGGGGMTVRYTEAPVQ